MRIKTLLLTAVAAAVLSTTGAGMATAAPYDRSGHHEMDRRGDRHDGDRNDGYRNRDWRGERHGVWRDPYYWSGYGHGYVGHDRVFMGLRSHNYNRFIGNPYWYHGRYVVRTYDRWGNVVFVEVNPYTGGFIGEIRF